MNTLFRSQTLASKMLYELLKLYGHSYLLITMKPIMDRVSRLKEALIGMGAGCDARLRMTSLKRGR